MPKKKGSLPLPGSNGHRRRGSLLQVDGEARIFGSDGSENIVFEEDDRNPRHFLDFELAPPIPEVATA